MATPATAPRVGFRQAFRTERAAATPRPPRTPLAVRAARWLARRLPAWPAIRTLLLSVAGFGMLTAAAWTLHVAAGLAVGGVSLLVLEALSGGDRR
ncbi:hypothetical protein [Nonomuraea sp. SBT364]|uniref:hypothetical protein n=1 Tax=Nonomuraea sp. SBT364 TaxID=1580530 RepID=UPI00066E3F7C|nr:hypothetical protein [Nonomuraea sp. SBT364]